MSNSEDKGCPEADGCLSSPAVSVIIPVYNVESYLTQCVDSVLRQTLADLELILVDDGSTDSSPQLCDMYAQKDERVRVIHRPNGGSSAARNAGIQDAKGRYVYFLDSDDYIVDHALERAVSYAERDRLDLFQFDCRAVDEQGEIAPAHDSMFRRNGAYPDVLDGPSMFAAMRPRNDFWPTVMRLLIKRSLLQESGLLFYVGIPHQDLLFTFILMLESTRCGYAPEPLFYYRVRQGSVTRTPTKEKNVSAHLCCLKEMVDYCSRRTFDPEVSRQIQAYFAWAFWRTHTLYWYLYGPKRRGSTVDRPKSWANREIRKPLFQLMKSLNYAEDPEIARCCRWGTVYEWRLTLDDVKRRLKKRFGRHLEKELQCCSNNHNSHR